MPLKSAKKIPDGAKWASWEDFDECRKMARGFATNSRMETALTVWKWHADRMKDFLVQRWGKKPGSRADDVARLIGSAGARRTGSRAWAIA